MSFLATILLESLNAFFDLLEAGFGVLLPKRATLDADVLSLGLQGKLEF